VILRADLDRANIRYEELTVSHESLLGRTMSLVDNTIKALKKEAELEVVLKDMEVIKTALDYGAMLLDELGGLILNVLND
jgi:hypothetical protein